jgi:hypothetical protein
MTKQRINTPGVTPHVTKSLITFIKVLRQDQIHWLIQFWVNQKQNSNKIESNSWSKSRNPQIWVSKFLCISWSIVREQTIAPCSNFINSWSFNQIHQISFKFNTLNLSWFLIQIPSRNLKSYNKESCSLFQNIQIHVFFEIFREREGPLLIKSNSNQFANLI